MSQRPQKPLAVTQMTLSGVHLIEASAGTGKTFNITRIVMRLLLETEYTIDKILVVTFTKAATQELKNRIAATLLEFKSTLENELEALNNHPASSDMPSFQHLQEDVLRKYMAPCRNCEDALKYLRKGVINLSEATLLLDEAPIYTINAFCQRELTRISFVSGLPFEFNIQNSTVDLVLECIQDEYRRLASNQQQIEILIDAKVDTPESFYKVYGQAIYSQLPLKFADKEQLEEELSSGLKNLVASPEVIAIQDILNQYYHEYVNFVNAALNKSKPPKFALTTMADLDALLAWFASPVLNVEPPALSKVLNGKSHIPKLSNDPSEIQKIKDAVEEYKKFVKKLNKLRAQYANGDVSRIAERNQFIYELILRLKKQITLKKNTANVLGHNDTVRILAEAITKGPDELLNQLRSNYPVALIDEFQDTDNHQYTIFSQLYPRQTADMLLMIGDPKQAIYGFRGGDIFTYLNASQNIDYAWSMQKNYRSTQGLITAYDLLFYGIDLSSVSTCDVIKRLPLEDQNQEDIGLNITAYEAEQLTHSAAEQTTNNNRADNSRADTLQNTTGSHQEHPLARTEIFGKNISAPWIYAGIPELKGVAEETPPIQFFYPEETYDDAFKSGNSTYKDSASIWVTNEIIRLLKSVSLYAKNDALQDIEPKDIAVLVRGKSEARQIQTALAGAGLKSVYLSDKLSVFASQEAQQVLALLEGLQHYRNTPKVLHACASELWGLSLTDVAALRDIMSPTYDENVEALVNYGAIWQESGIYSLLTMILKERFVSRKGKLARERQITNYLHLADILQEQSKSLTQHGALISWLATQIHLQAAEVSVNDEDIYIQRLDSDDELIKIVTIHGSKGLEYPVVFVPYAGFAPYQKEQDVLQYQTIISDKEQQIVQVGKSLDAEKYKHAQDFAELTRLLYVAVTRAAFRCYIGLGKPTDFNRSTVHGALGITADKPQDLLSALDMVQQLHSESFMFHPYSIHLQSDQIDSNQYTRTCKSASFSGDTSMQWEVQSFSKITRQHSFTDLTEKEREQDEKPSKQKANNSKQIRFTLPKGANAGNLLHNILEDHNFSEPFKLDEHKEHLATFADTHTQQVKEDDLVDWFEDILASPIQLASPSEEHVVETFALRDLNHTLKEPEFYFPLASVNVADLAKLLGEHRRRDLETKSTHQLNGMLHGFIDLLFEYNGKYYVADYKSNYLGDSLEEYNTEAMTQAIEAHDYDLQYLIYSWALHQMLSQKLPNYSFPEHFGGVYYFFLRGMSRSGPDMSGIYQKQITPEEMDILTQIFDINKTGDGV